MRFQSNFQWDQVLKYGAQRLTRTVSRPINALYRKVRFAMNPTSFVNKVVGDIDQNVKQIAKPPTTLKGYVAIGRHYVAKKLLFALVLALLITRHGTLIT